MAGAPAIVLLGPPGSGKGTQAEQLTDELGFTALATGDLLRAARKEGTELGRQAEEYMDRGDLVPDDVIVGLIEEKLDELDGRPVLFDGFPRTVGQADALADALSRRDRALSAVVQIDVSDDEVTGRILSRGQGREDDNPETVRERLHVYHEETEPLARYYDERGLLRRVDGTGDVDDVHDAIRAALG
jgi:adenylate kinase